MKSLKEDYKRDSSNHRPTKETDNHSYTHIDTCRHFEPPVPNCISLDVGGNLHIHKDKISTAVVGYICLTVLREVFE